MFKLESSEFYKVQKLIETKDELTIPAVINGNNPGEIFVNDRENPTAVLIKTAECNLLAGNASDEKFNSEISSELGFWDQVNADNIQWERIITKVHKNPYVRKYKRRRYVLNKENFNEVKVQLEEGVRVEPIDLDLIKRDELDNSEDVLEWIEGWGEEENFIKCGAGCIVRDEENIMSWSISDCAFKDKIAIGIHTDGEYRKRGFALIAASHTIKECFGKGYNKIEWSCVATNKGSIAIAEKLGFKCESVYEVFTSYPPIENIRDLSEAEWCEWGEYLDKASSVDREMKIDALHCYIKGNNLNRTISSIKDINKEDIKIDYEELNGWIKALQKRGLCGQFDDSRWRELITKFI